MDVWMYEGNCKGNYKGIIESIILSIHKQKETSYVCNSDQ